MARKLPEKKKFQGQSLGDFELPAAANDEDQSRSLHERAMLVRSTISRWYGSGADHEVVEEVRVSKEAKGNIGSFTKRFMTRDRLKKINRITNDARKFHKSVTLPWGDSGARLLNVTQFFDYKKKMSVFERDFYLAVEEFLEAYPKAIHDQKVRLGKLWRESDYPSIDEMRERFRFTVLVEPLPSSEDFRIKLSADEAVEIKREYEAEMRSRLKGAVHDVFARVRETVSEVQEKLADPDAQIRSTTFEALRKLVAALPQLNAVVRDPAIAKLGNEIATSLLSMDTDAIKHDAKTRSTAKKKADDILAALKPLRSNWGGSDATEA